MEARTGTYGNDAFLPQTRQTLGEGHGTPMRRRPPNTTWCVYSSIYCPSTRPSSIRPSIIHPSAQLFIRLSSIRPSSICLSIHYTSIQLPSIHPHTHPPLIRFSILYPYLSSLICGSVTCLSYLHLNTTQHDLPHRQSNTLPGDVRTVTPHLSLSPRTARGLGLQMDLGFLGSCPLPGRCRSRPSPPGSWRGAGRASPRG